MSSSEEVYFAARSAEDCAAVLMQKSQSFYTTLNSNKYLDKLHNMYRYYYGSHYEDSSSGHQVSFAGEQGELVQVPVNHFRNLAKNIINMITANRPILEARAINTDYKSLSQTYLANGILDYYMREKDLESIVNEAVEMSLILGAAFVKMAWNSMKGEAYETDDSGKPLLNGEMEFSLLSPLDVVVDGTLERYEDREWVNTRSAVTRYNLIAKYPQYHNEIMAIKTKNDPTSSRLGSFSNDKTDLIYIYEFFHKKTEAIEDGRYMLYLNDKAVLMDGPLPYRDIPIFRLAPNSIMGTPYGYSEMFDVYPIQEMMNSIYSGISTNQNAHLVQSLFIPRGSDIVPDSVIGGMTIIEGNAPPQAVQLTSTPEEAFKFLEVLKQDAETLVGVNSVTRGNPEASLRSGTALALVQSMSIQFQSGFQRAYVKFLENVGTSLIEILKDYAAAPKMIAIVGKNKAPLLKEFTGDMIKDVQRVVVDVGNPLSRCLEKGTEVLMFDGSKSKVEDIKVDDWVMGPDSNPRTVSNVNSGQEMMYKVVSKDSNRKISYGCNESHILTLKYCSDDTRYNAKKGDVIDITVSEYLKLTERQKRLLQGFKTGVEFEAKDLTVPAYILGSWLGDGGSRTTSITSMDEEIVNEWRDYANSIGMQLRTSTCDNSGKAKTYYITSGIANGKSDRNPFMNELRSMEVIQNKHIPQIYLTGSRQQRLELLAGLIDTDGHINKTNNQTVHFTQKSDRLTNDVVFLAESLGFRVTSKKRPSASSELVGEITGDVNFVTIGGNTWDIPTRLPRKKINQCEKHRDWLNYGIEVLPVSEGTYYGFTLREEPHFVLGDFTVTHNTIAGRVEMADHLAQMKLIQTPQQYMMVMETGRIDTMYEGDMSDLLNIKRENESLLEGKPVMADILDRHRLHIVEHRAVINDPDLRSQPELYNAAKAHIQEHINMLRTVDPDLLQLIGEQPLMNQNQQQGVIPDGGQVNPEEMPGGPMANQDVIQQGGVQKVMDQSQAGPQAPADQVIDGQPSVDASILPNSSLEPRAK